GAFFRGQVEEPVTGLTSLVTHQDLPVLVSINSQGVYVIDDVQCTMLLGLKYEELSWDFAKPSRDDDPDCLPCLFLQFMVLENGTRVSKILQVFSKQAVMMDALISSFVQELKQKAVNFSDEVDRPHYDTSTDSDEGFVGTILEGAVEGGRPMLNYINQLLKELGCLSYLELSTVTDGGPLLQTNPRVVTEEGTLVILPLFEPNNTQVPLTMVTRRELPQSCLSNKLSKLTLATFDEDDDGNRVVDALDRWVLGLLATEPLEPP
ncbi:hypothetical protein J437_LFUL003858, partial [Ladona fulva]